MSPLRTVGIVGLPVFLAVVNQTMVSVALPAIGADLNQLTILPWLVTGYMLTLTIAAPVYGVLGDSHGRARLLCIGVAIFTLGALICALSQSIWTLALGRLVQGVGGGGLMALSQALIGQLVAPKDRGRTQGYVAAIVVGASTVGPVVGGVLVHYFGWRWLFLAPLLPAGLALYLILRARIPATTGTGSRFDMLAFVCLTATVCAAAATMELVRFAPIFSAPMGAVTIALIALTVRGQRHSGNPMFPPRLFADPGIRICNGIVACHGAGLIGIITLLPLFETLMRGTQTLEISAHLLVMSVAWGLSGVVIGNLISATGRLTVFPMIALPVSIGTVLYIGVAGAGLTEMGLVTVYVITGFGVGTVMSVVHTTVQQIAPDDLRGRASGNISFFRSIGAALGTTLITVVVFAIAPAVSDGAGLLANNNDGAGAAWGPAFRAGFMIIAGFFTLSWFGIIASPVRRVA